MSVLEPEVRRVQPETVVPVVPVVPAGEPVEAAAPAVVDHVRSHSVTCYWDFVDCRWRCSGS